MADRKKPKKGRVKSKVQEDRVTLPMRRELLEDLEALANNEELNLNDYISQILQRRVTAKQTRDREFEEFLESQQGASRPKLKGLPTTFGQVVANRNNIPLPDPFRYTDTDFARALLKRALQNQDLPLAWGYQFLCLFDREGLTPSFVGTPNYINPLARIPGSRMMPFWKALPGEASDIVMSQIRKALKGDPVHFFFPLPLEGRQLNGDMKLFDLGKGLVGCALKQWWEKDPQSEKPPTEADKLSQFYLAQSRLQLDDAQAVWWVQETGVVTDHRSQFVVTPLFPFLSPRLTHVEDCFEADMVEKIMSRVPTVTQTREKQSFTREENLENLLELRSYTLYPLTNIRPKEPEVVMMTMSNLSSIILDTRKIYSLG